MKHHLTTFRDDWLNAPLRDWRRGLTLVAAGAVIGLLLGIVIGIVTGAR